MAEVMTAQKAAARTEDAVKIYGKGQTEVRALDGVTVGFASGRYTAVMGPSGSGKSTLLHCVAGLDSLTSGRAFIGDVDLSTLNDQRLTILRRDRIGFVFQAFNLLDALDVEENILFPALLAPGGPRAARPRAEALMERLGLGRRRRARPPTLSGGEKQRVAIARALINAPPLLLADEPTGNLDSQTGQEVMMILHDVARDDGAAVLIVTHDPRVEEIADRVLWLEDGALRDRKAEVHEWMRDPVCGMRVDAWTAVHELEYEGQRYVFCSQRCLERFEASPGDYLGGSRSRPPSRPG
jgi:putative ABC transport system ATP-binding protein